MRVRATACATARSNAVGAVELECTPHGLVLGFFGVGSFSDGYAPGALTTGTQVVVPWSGVQQARLEGEQLFLQLEAEGLPHDRLTLTRFSTGDPLHPIELRRQRLLLRLAALGAALVGSILATAIIPRLSVQSGALIALGVGAAAAGSVLGLGFMIEPRLLGSGPGEAQIRRLLAGELESYLPHLVRSPFAPAPARRPFPIPNLAGLLPRTVAAVAVTLAAGVITALVSTDHLLRDPERRPALARESATGGETEPPAPALPGPAPVAAPTEPNPPPSDAALPREEPSDAQAAAGLSILRRCLCDRASSALWAEPIPTLSVLLLEAKKLERRNRTRTSLEVAVVNNGDKSLENITVRAVFFEGEGKNKREVAQRPLYFEGPLGPGRAVKWRTEARGTSWRLEEPYVGEIELDGIGAAAPATFRELLNANHRPVRLHAARMLAFLGDPTAREAALQLKDALRSSEAPYLRRLLAALGDIRVCDVRVTGNGPERRAEACVFNGSDEDRDHLGVQFMALERGITPNRPVSSPPSILGEKKWPIPGTLEAHAGVMVHLQVDLGEVDATKAQAFEVAADRFDLLE